MVTDEIVEYQVETEGWWNPWNKPSKPKNTEEYYCS